MFSSYFPTPMNSQPPFPEKKEQIKHRILISQLCVSSNDHLEGSLREVLMLVFLPALDPKMPLRFNYLSIFLFTTKSLTLLLCCCIEKKSSVDAFFFSNSKGRVTSKMKWSCFLVFDKRDECFISFKVIWRHGTGAHLERVWIGNCFSPFSCPVLLSLFLVSFWFLDMYNIYILLLQKRYYFMKVEVVFKNFR